MIPALMSLLLLTPPAEEPKLSEAAQKELKKLEGKWKVSQNRPQADRDGVVRGLCAHGDDRSRVMADLVAAGGATPQSTRRSTDAPR